MNEQLELARARETIRRYMDLPPVTEPDTLPPIEEPSVFPTEGVIFSPRIVKSRTYKVHKGKFVPFEGEQVRIKDGIAIVKHETLERLNGEYLYNPVTGDIFQQTKKKTGFFNSLKRIFVKPYHEYDTDDG